MGGEMFPQQNEQYRVSSIAARPCNERKSGQPFFRKGIGQIIVVRISFVFSAGYVFLLSCTI